MAVALAHRPVTRRLEFLECSISITTAPSTPRNWTRQRKHCGNLTVTVMGVSPRMKCGREAMTDAGRMQIATNAGVKAMDRRPALVGNPGLKVRAVERVAMSSALLNLMIGSKGMIRIAVLVPSGSRSGTHGCAMIAPQQVLTRWGRVSRRGVVNRGESDTILRPHLLEPRTLHGICALHNRRILLERIPPGNVFRKVHLRWAAGQIAETF
jgi:hypothetical protein